MTEAVEPKGINPEQLKSWIIATGRKYLVVRTDDLIDSLRGPAWADNVEAVQGLVDVYAKHRGSQPTGWIDPGVVVRGEVRAVAIHKSDLLTIEEIDEAIEQLTRLREQTLSDLKTRGAIRENEA